MPVSGIPEDAFYVVLPYEDPEQLKQLNFTTDIKRADIAITIDLSGSMSEEHANLKTGIKDIIIDGIRTEIPDTQFALVKFGTKGNTVYEVTQKITNDENLVKTAIDTITSVGGDEELFWEALYQTVTGEGQNDVDWPSAYSTTNYPTTVPCTAGTSGGVCYRSDALPIIVFATDECFNTTWGHTESHVVAAMNDRNAKFIGIYSGGSCGSLESVSTGTASVDGVTGNSFNQYINADGSGLSDKVVDAVVELSQNIQIDISTIKKGLPNDYGIVIDTAEFIKAVTPNSTIPAGGVINGLTFEDIKPGTEVIFDVTFQNEIFENNDPEAKLFIATINVLGEGALLSSRDVFIIVPGTTYSGPGS